jgi:hypothetical protein
MSFGLIFWIIMLIWLLSELGPRFGFSGGPYITYVSTILLFILFVLIGWKVFGPPVHP